MRSSLIITSLLLLPISAFALPVSSDAIERDYVLDGSLLSVKRSVWPKVGEGKALSEAAPPGPVLRPGFTTLPPSRWPDPGPGMEYPPADFDMPLDSNGIPKAVQEGIPWQLNGYGPPIPRPTRYYEGHNDPPPTPTRFDSMGNPLYKKRSLFKPSKGGKDKYPEVLRPGYGPEPGTTYRVDEIGPIDHQGKPITKVPQPWILKEEKSKPGKSS